MLSFLKNIVWPQPDNGEDAGDEPTVDRVGFQVMYVRPESPAHLAGLLPVFDYIVAANGTTFFVRNTHTHTQLFCFKKKPSFHPTPSPNRRQTTILLWSWCRRRQGSL